MSNIITINIVSLVGKISVYNVNSNDSILELKKEIAERNGYFHDIIRLIYKGKALDDNNKKISEYNIENDSKVFIIEKIRGD